MMTPAFLSEGLLLQALHEFAMILREHHGLGGFAGPSLPNGVITGSIGFLDQMAPVCLDFHKHCAEIVLASRTNWK